MEVSGTNKLSPTPFTSYQNEFTQWLQRLGYAMSTVSGYTRYLETFLKWLTAQDLQELWQIQASDLEAYHEYLHQRKHQQKQGGLSSSYIQSHINVIRLLSKYLELSGEEKIYTGNLKVERGLVPARNILSQKEIKALYSATDDSPKGLRDKALLSLYYGCGLRYSEGVRLEVQDIDYNKGLLYVAPGKNYQSRFIPINEAIIKDLQAYENYGRGYFAKAHSRGFLLSVHGRPLSSQTIRRRIKYMLTTSGIGKAVTLHGLRHSIATHLLSEGMPLEQISKFLGHKSLESTQIYTRLVEEGNPV